MGPFTYGNRMRLPYGSNEFGIAMEKGCKYLEYLSDFDFPLHSFVAQAKRRAKEFLICEAIARIRTKRLEQNREAKAPYVDSDSD